MSLGVNTEPRTIVVCDDFPCRGQGRDRMRQDLNSVQAYQSIFKHIRSVSQVSPQSAVFVSLPSSTASPVLADCFDRTPHASFSFHHCLSRALADPTNACLPTFFSSQQAIFMTAMDPLDKEMGPTPEFREHFRKLLSEMRHREVSLLKCCVLRWPVVV